MLISRLQRRFAEFSKHLIRGKRIVRIAAEALRLNDMRRELFVTNSRPDIGLEILIEAPLSRQIKLCVRAVR